MSDSLNRSTQTLARASIDPINSFLAYFFSGATWEDWPRGSNAVFLEQLKMDLVGLAGTIENRLQHLYAAQTVQDFGDTNEAR